MLNEQNMHTINYYKQSICKENFFSLNIQCCVADLSTVDSQVNQLKSYEKDRPNHYKLIKNL